MALYTGAAYFHVDGQAALKLTGSGIQLDHQKAAVLLGERILADALGAAVGEVTASITEDHPTGSAVLFSATGTIGTVLVALRDHIDTLAA